MGFLHTVCTSSRKLRSRGGWGSGGSLRVSSVAPLPLRSIPKDIGGVPWAPSPPFDSSLGSIFVSLWSAGSIPENLSGHVALQESAVRALCVRGGGGRSVGFFTRLCQMLSCVVRLQPHFGIWAFLFLSSTESPAIWCLIQAMFLCRAGRGF